MATLSTPQNSGKRGGVRVKARQIEIELERDWRIDRAANRVPDPVRIRQGWSGWRVVISRMEHVDDWVAVCQDEAVGSGRARAAAQYKSGFRSRLKPNHAQQHDTQKQHAIQQARKQHRHDYSSPT